MCSTMCLIFNLYSTFNALFNIQLRIQHSTIHFIFNSLSACTYSWSIIYIQQFQPFTVNSRLADTSLLRTPRYYGQQQNPRRKLQPFDWNKLPLLRTLATTDLRTLYSVPTSQFYCFLSRYSGHRAASWNICTHIKSIFSAFWDCLCLFWSISASSVHQSKFLHLFLLRPSLQSRCHE